jgi:aspartate/methionine/tyrosine aminotransferase
VRNPRNHRYSDEQGHPEAAMAVADLYERRSA